MAADALSDDQFEHPPQADWSLTGVYQGVVDWFVQAGWVEQAAVVLLLLWLVMLLLAYWRALAPAVGGTFYDLILRPLYWFYLWALLVPLQRVLGRWMAGPKNGGVEAEATPAAEEEGFSLLTKARGWLTDQRQRARDRGFEYWLGIFTAVIAAASFAVVLILIGSAVKGPTGDTSTEILTYRIGLATLLGALTLPLLAHRARVNERQTQVTEAGHITDRIIKATELLGAVKQAAGEGVTARYEPNIEVRLGAIFTLERVAKESRTDHVTIMETFAAYVRENLRRQREEEEARREAEKAAAKRDAGDPEKHSEEGESEGAPVAEEAAQENPQAKADKAPLVIEPWEDVLAVLRVINRRNDPPKKWDGEQAFPWAGMSLERTDLRSLFPFGSAAAPKWRSPGANLQRAILQRANLEGANLEGANLWGANLEGAKLQRADLQGANLQRADLQGANLWGANLWGANLEGADLQGANLWGANLEGAYLQGAYLQGANLQGASIVGVALTLGGPFPDIKNGGREGASQGEPPGGGPQGLTQSQLESAFGDKRTADQVRALGRKDLSPPEHWHPKELDSPVDAREEWRKWRERRAAEKEA